MLRDNTAYCVKLSDEDLSLHSNKTESVGLRKLSYRESDIITRMWAYAQRDGRPAECRWRPLFNSSTPQSFADAQY